MSDRIGQQLGNYRLTQLLGQGGFGAVYLVRDRRVKQNLYALKEVINPDKHDRERFLFEGDLLKRLDHRALPRGRNRGHSGTGDRRKAFRKPGSAVHRR